MSAILCSACFDRLGCQDVRAIMPLQICDACGQPCLGYLGTPVAQHRCSRCGHGWHGPCAGAELCGDCWRQAQPVLHARVDPSPTPLVVTDSRPWLRCLKRADNLLKKRPPDVAVARGYILKALELLALQAARVVPAPLALDALLASIPRQMTADRENGYDHLVWLSDVRAALLVPTRDT